MESTITNDTHRRTHSSLLRAGALAGSLAAAALLAVPATAEAAAPRHDAYCRADHDHGKHRYRHDRGHRWGHYDRGPHYRGHERRGYWRHRSRDSGRYHRPSYRHAPRRHFEIPRRIARFRDYSRWLHGRTYYHPHGHEHRIYRFPVYYGHQVRYEPFAYCGGKLHSRGSFYYDGPRLSIRWGW